MRHLLAFIDSMARALEGVQDTDSPLSSEQRFENVAHISKALKHFVVAMRAMGIEPEMEVPHSHNRAGNFNFAP